MFDDLEDERDIKDFISPDFLFASFSHGTFSGGVRPVEKWKEREKASVLVQRLSYPTETVLPSKIPWNRIVLSFKDSPRKPLRWRPKERGRRRRQRSEDIENDISYLPDSISIRSVRSALSVLLSPF